MNAKIKSKIKERESARKEYNASLYARVCPNCGANLRKEVDQCGDWYICEGTCVTNVECSSGALWWKRTTTISKPRMMWPISG